MRSAGQHIDFIPPQAKTALRFFPELTDSLHLQDRVGTYGSLHYAEVT
jgi:S-adenosylmethionine-diacylglycerol 3-amino-3-carboxypropyl transferase